MNSVTVTFIAALVILPTVGLLGWAWFTLIRVQEVLESLTGLKAIHFKV